MKMPRHHFGKSTGSCAKPSRAVGIASPIGWRIWTKRVSYALFGLAMGAAGAACGGASSTASAATLNLGGGTVTLPDGVVFTTPYLTGSNDVTNNAFTPSQPGTLIEGGGPAGTTYSGII